MNALVALILYVLKDKRVVWSLKNIIPGKRLPSHNRKVSLDKMELSVGGEKSLHRNLSCYNQTEIEMETCFCTPLQRSTTMEMLCLGANQHENVIDSNVSMDQEDVVLKLTNVAKQQAEVALKQTEVAFIQTQAAEVQIRTAHRLSLVAVEQNIEVMRLLESVSKHNESFEQQVDVDVHVFSDLNKALKDGDESNTGFDQNDVMIQTNDVESKKAEGGEVVNPTFTAENQGIQAVGQTFIAKGPADHISIAENQTDQAKKQTLAADKQTLTSDKQTLTDDKQTCTAVKQPCTSKNQTYPDEKQTLAENQSEEAAEQTDLAKAKPTKHAQYVHVNPKRTLSTYL